MPEGAYRYDDGTIEDFQCAPGPAGWRYVGRTSGATPGGRVDVAVDSRWRQVRLEIHGGGWLLRGGVTGPKTLWVRGAAGDLAGAQEHTAAAAGFTGSSPGLLVAIARSLALTVGVAARVRLVAVTAPVLATRLVEQEWTLHEVSEHETETAPLAVERYSVADLATGVTEVLYLSGDVALSGPGVELHALASPPTGI